MGRRLWLLVTLVLGLSITLSGFVINVPIATGTGAPRAVSQSGTSDSLAQPDTRTR